MSNNQLGLSLATLRPAIPVLTALLGAMGIGGGLYDFSAAPEGARAFGITIDDSIAAKTVAASSSSIPPATKSFVYVHGIRNIGSGLGLLGMLAFWQFSPMCQNSPLAAAAVQRCLGISLITGTVVGLGDGYIISQFAAEEGVSAEAKQLATGQSKGHALMAIPILAMGLSWWFM